MTTSVVQLGVNNKTFDPQWNIDNNIDGERKSSYKFLPHHSNTSLSQSSRKQPRRGEGKLQIIYGALRSRIGGNSGSQVKMSKVTPILSSRDGGNSVTKRAKWKRFAPAQVNNSNGENMEKYEEYSLALEGPNNLFQMAAKGDVKKISAITNAYPERIMSRDAKGASILHHAAVDGRTNVMDYVLADPQGIELLNAVDETDATPLHWAVRNDNGESVDYLLSRGADPTLKNISGESPLHTCVVKNSMDALRVLIKHKDIVNMEEKMSTTGETALHLAANVDHIEAAELLFAAGGKACSRCNQGYMPLHAAAFNGSKKFMEFILQKCEEYGYTKQQILTFSDKERCSPLHCAVSGGNPEAIRMCLSYGAKLDEQQADLSTPMHLVCAQGAFDSVKLMFEIVRDQAARTLTIADNQKHTPLHKAAMYGHSDIIRYLIEAGADIDAVDANLNTPLLLAASRENWTCVRTLVELGAALMLKNQDDRNFMHMIVLNGGDIRKLEIDDFKCLRQNPGIRALLNEPDSFGCTALHYACQEGNLASLDTLMTLGVSARLKSSGNQSPLHFAAMYGRYNACRKLIDSPQGPNIINEKDDMGMSPLHYSCQNGHTKVTQLLLNKGAAFQRNTTGESVLHLTASNGYTRTIRILVDMNQALLDEQDEDGNTALHHAGRESQQNTVRLLLDINAPIKRNKAGHTFFTSAIQSHNRDVTLAAIEHERWEEMMQVLFEDQGSIIVPALLMIQHLPDAWVVALDRCVTTADCHPKSKDYWIKYHFKYLQPKAENRDAIEKIRKKHAIEQASGKTSNTEINELGRKNAKIALPALNKMVSYNRVECLRHPVSLAYLRMKWNAYGRWIHGFNLFVYLLGLIPLTCLICTTDSSVHNDIGVSATSNYTERVVEALTYSTFQFAMMILLTVLSSCQILKEIFQMFRQGPKYFTDFVNLIEWILYCSCLLYVVPFYTGFPLHWQFEFGAVAILLAWFNLLLFLQRFDFSGIYVIMFLEILRTLLKVLCVFSFIVVAFALSFYVLMNNEPNKSFSTPPLSIMRVITMLLGDIGYVDSYLVPFVDGNDTTLHFSVLTMILLSFFIITMPILLMNLLIGLAVGDIAEVKNNAALQRLAMQVEMHTEIEQRLSSQVLRLVDKDEELVYPNRRCGFINKLLGFVGAGSDISDKYDKSSFSATDRQIGRLDIELQKQKERTKEMQTLLQKQHDLMRLIVQKMEIRSEADDQDEGSHPDTQRRAQQSRSRQGISSSVGSKLLAIRALKSSK